MKIEYKTIVHGMVKELKWQDSREVVQWVACCDKMRSAIERRIIEPSGDGFLLMNVENEYECGYYPSRDHLCPGKFCPYCGTEVELIEVKKVRRETRTRRVRAKTTPAHAETYTVEVGVK